MSSFTIANTPAGSMIVEIDETDSDGIELLGIRSLPTFEDACEAVKKNAEFLLAVLDAIDPDEVELSCGIKVGVEGGNTFWGLAKTSGEAHYDVKITWKAKPRLDDKSPR